MARCLPLMIAALRRSGWPNLALLPDDGQGSLPRPSANRVTGFRAFFLRALALLFASPGFFHCGPAGPLEVRKTGFVRHPYPGKRALVPAGAGLRAGRHFGELLPLPTVQQVT